jgi:hypothetical protein
MTPVIFFHIYLGLCRVLGFVRCIRETDADKDFELMVLRHTV